MNQSFFKFIVASSMCMAMSTAIAPKAVRAFYPPQAITTSTVPGVISQTMDESWSDLTLQEDTTIDLAGYDLKVRSISTNGFALTILDTAEKHGTLNCETLRVNGGSEVVIDVKSERSEYPVIFHKVEVTAGRIDLKSNIEITANEVEGFGLINLKRNGTLKEDEVVFTVEENARIRMNGSRIEMEQAYGLGSSYYPEFYNRGTIVNYDDENMMFIMMFAGNFVNSGTMDVVGINCFATQGKCMFTAEDGSWISEGSYVYGESNGGNSSFFEFQNGSINDFTRVDVEGNADLKVEKGCDFHANELLIRSTRDAAPITIHGQLDLQKMVLLQGMVILENGSSLNGDVILSQDGAVECELRIQEHAVLNGMVKRDEKYGSNAKVRVKGYINNPEPIATVANFIFDDGSRINSMRVLKDTQINGEKMDVKVEGLTVYDTFEFVRFYDSSKVEFNQRSLTMNDCKMAKLRVISDPEEGLKEDYFKSVTINNCEIGSFFIRKVQNLRLEGCKIGVGDVDESSQIINSRVNIHNCEFTDIRTLTIASYLHCEYAEQFYGANVQMVTISDSTFSGGNVLIEDYFSDRIQGQLNLDDVPPMARNYGRVLILNNTFSDGSCLTVADMKEVIVSACDFGEDLTLIDCVNCNVKNGMGENCNTTIAGDFSIFSTGWDELSDYDNYKTDTKDDGKVWGVLDVESVGGNVIVSGVKTWLLIPGESKMVVTGDLISQGSEDHKDRFKDLRNHIPEESILRYPDLVGFTANVYDLTSRENQKQANVQVFSGTFGGMVVSNGSTMWIDSVTVTDRGVDANSGAQLFICPDKTENGKAIRIHGTSEISDATVYIGRNPFSSREVVFTAENEDLFQIGKDSEVRICGGKYEVSGDKGSILHLVSEGEDRVRVAVIDGEFTSPDTCIKADSGKKTYCDVFRDGKLVNELYYLDMDPQLKEYAAVSGGKFTSRATGGYKAWVDPRFISHNFYPVPIWENGKVEGEVMYVLIEAVQEVNYEGTLIPAKKATCTEGGHGEYYDFTPLLKSHGQEGHLYVKPFQSGMNYPEMSINDYTKPQGHSYGDPIFTWKRVNDKVSWSADEKMIVTAHVHCSKCGCDHELEVHQSVTCERGVADWKAEVTYNNFEDDVHKGENVIPHTDSIISSNITVTAHQHHRVAPWIYVGTEIDEKNEGTKIVIYYVFGDLCNYEDERTFYAYIKDTKNSDPKGSGVATRTVKVDKRTYQLKGTFDASMGTENYIDLSFTTSAKNMTDPVDCYIKDPIGDETSCKQTVSVADYLTYIANSSRYDDEIRRLCVAYLDYGAAAQIYFKVDTKNLANSKISEETRAMFGTYPDNMLDMYTSYDRAGMVKAIESLPEDVRDSFDFAGVMMTFVNRPYVSLQFKCDSARTPEMVEKYIRDNFVFVMNDGCKLNPTYEYVDKADGQYVNVRFEEDASTYSFSEICKEDKYILVYVNGQSFKISPAGYFGFRNQNNPSANAEQANMCKALAYFSGLYYNYTHQDI